MDMKAKTYTALPTSRIAEHSRHVQARAMRLLEYKVKNPDKHSQKLDRLVALACSISSRWTTLYSAVLKTTA